MTSGKPSLQPTSMTAWWSPEIMTSGREEVGGEKRLDRKCGETRRLALKPGSGSQGWGSAPLSLQGPAGRAFPAGFPVQPRASRAGRKGCAAGSGRRLCGLRRSPPRRVPPSPRRRGRSWAGCGAARRPWAQSRDAGCPAGFLAAREVARPPPASPSRPPVPEVRGTPEATWGALPRRGVPGASRDPAGPHSPPPERAGGRYCLHAPGPATLAPRGALVRRPRFSEARLQAAWRRRGRGTQADRR